MRSPQLACACALLALSIPHRVEAGQFGAAEGVLFPLRNYLVEGAHSSLAFVDLDGDGHRDLYRGGATFLRGRSDGSFGDETSLAPVAVFPLAWIRQGDANGDGAEDVLGVAGDGTAGVLAVDPLGGAPHWTPLPAPGNPVRAEVARLDQDPWPEVVVISGVPGQRIATVYRGDGSGGWTLDGSSLVPPGGHIGLEGVTICDLDHDGMSEVVLSSFLSGLSVLTSTPTGLAPHQSIPWANLYNEPVAGDFDGDGWDDIVVSWGENGELLFFRNLQGTLAPPVTVPSPGPIHPANTLHAADFDGSPGEELFFGGGGGIWILKFTGSGFSLLEALDTWSAYRIALLDFDGVGATDLAWLGFGGVQVRRRDALWRWEGVESLDFEGLTTAFDLDGAGPCDFITQIPGGVRVRLDGGPPQDSIVALPQNVRLRTIDLDGDARLDLLVGPRAALANPAHVGKFLSSQQLAPLPDLAVLGILDWDSDGRRDVAYIGVPPNRLSIRRGIPGGFDPVPLSYTLPVELSLSALTPDGGDFDGDGVGELLASDSTGRTWRLAPNLSSAGVAQPTPFPFPATAASCRSRGLERDVVIVAHASGLSSWTLDAAGQWIELASGPPANLGGLEQRDVDGDGDMDLVSNSSGRVTVVRMGARGQFLDAWSYGDTRPTSQVSVADLDHDGRLDLCLSAQSLVEPGYKLHVLEQASDLPGRSCAGAGPVAGCVPDLSLRGRASLDPEVELELTLSRLPVGARTVIFCGPLGVPVSFASGRLCIGAPKQRLPSRLASGSLACEASVGFNLNRWIRTQPGLFAGSHLAVQAWVRAPGGTVGISDAFDFSVFP